MASRWDFDWWLGMRAMESEVRPKGRWKPHVSEGRAKILAA
jgi:hypothetical protein